MTRKIIRCAQSRHGCFCAEKEVSSSTADGSDELGEKISKEKQEKCVLDTISEYLSGVPYHRKEMKSLCRVMCYTIRQLLKISRLMDLIVKLNKEFTERVSSKRQRQIDVENERTNSQIFNAEPGHFVFICAMIPGRHKQEFKGIGPRWVVEGKEEAFNLYRRKLSHRKDSVCSCKTSTSIAVMRTEVLQVRNQLVLHDILWRSIR